MKLPFFSRHRDFVVEPLAEDDALWLSTIHREDFLRPWTVDEFDALLAQATVFGFAAREVGNTRVGPAGFVLARLAGDEAEILTIAVLRSHRRLGLGRDLLEAVMRELHAQRASALFLEVDEANTAAMALYRRLGFRQVGRRPAYYVGPDAARSAALILRRDLNAGSAPGGAHARAP